MRARQAGFVVAILWTITVPAAGHDAPVRFDIPAQRLTPALLEFARQARLSIGFPDELTDGLEAPALHGRMPPATALARLLAGSGLTFSEVGDGVIRVRRQPAAGTAAPGAELPAAVPLPAARPVDDLPPARIEEIVTVGTRLASARAAGLLPVSLVERPRIDVVGATSADELFRSLAAAGGVSFTGIDNYFYGVNDARGDVASLNLRDLGSGNTLMLLNGRRMVLHPGVQAEGRVIATTVNANSLPVGAIERVEILRDGASSIYGSEAVGGVVNTIMRRNADGVSAEILRGSAENSGLDETRLELSAGFGLPGGGRASLFGSALRRDRMPAGDRAFSASSDLRPLVAGTPFDADADFNNTAASSAWGQFTLPVAVSRDGVPITTGTGLFHIQPAGFDGCRAELPGNLCIDDDTIDDALRSDNNAYRDLVPGLRRDNLFALLAWPIAGTTELYAELGWYDARSENDREPSNPLSSHPITIPADNYWNPFGPATFADGRPNPNRLPGIDAPPEGLPLRIDTRVRGGFYRVNDAGPRRIVVDNDSRRLLAGLRGELGDWAWDGALLYSDATTTDTTYNRISSSLFQAALARDTPDAYNPFNGGDPARLRSGDATPNPQEVIDAFLIDVERYNETSLALADLQLSTAEVAVMPAGPVGLGVGVELRRERFAEDRDPRLDGSIGYTDRVTGEHYDSDVMQSSATPDSAGSRIARSLYTELSLPILDEDTGQAWPRRLDAQVAVRYEHLSDVGEAVSPRIAVGLEVLPGLSLRGAWSQGYSAPNLPQVNAGAVPRIQVVRDWYRCQALINKGLAESFGACVGEDVRAVEVVTSGSELLEPETSTNLALGLVWRPAGRDGLTVTVDYWRIAQSGMVGLFGEENHVALDYLLRLDGESNPAVTRAELRDEDIALFAGSGLAPVGLLEQVDDRYLNLDQRITRGLDVAAYVDLETETRGRFRASVEATRLLEADQSVSPLGRAIFELGEPAIPVVGAGSLLRQNGRPRWRAGGHLEWSAGSVRAGVLARYVGSVIDTSAIQDRAETFWHVDDWLTVSAFGEIVLPTAVGDDLRLRVGARNLFEATPPLADEALGYFAGLHESQGRYWYLALGLGF